MTVSRRIHNRPENNRRTRERRLASQEFHQRVWVHYRPDATTAQIKATETHAALNTGHTLTFLESRRVYAFGQSRVVSVYDVVPPRKANSLHDLHHHLSALPQVLASDTLLMRHGKEVEQ